MNGDEWTTCSDAWASDEAALGYTIYVTFILFGFPTLVLGICYTLIVFRLYSSKRITKHMRPLSVVNMTVNRGAEQGEDGTMGISGLEGSTQEEGAERIAKKCLKRRHRRQKHDTEDDSIRVNTSEKIMFPRCLCYNIVITMFHSHYLFYLFVIVGLMTKLGFLIKNCEQPSFELITGVLLIQLI